MSQHTPGAEPPLPNDVSQGWLPEDKRQTPQSPLPQPKFWGYTPARFPGWWRPMR